MTSAPALLLALDWGTTSARAWRLGPGGEVRARRDAPLGIQNVRAGFPEALAALLGDWVADPAPRLACGMIGSRQGWVEAPYVDCPASPESLAAAIVPTPGREIAVVPGVACRDPEGVPDVMRGEEAQVAGAVPADAGPTLAILPGTHSKWVAIERGEIRAFASFMTGEVYGVLRGHSILGRMIEDAVPTIDARAFARGVRRGMAEGAAGALLHRLFGARTLALAGELAPAEVGDYLSGMLIGGEVAAGRAWAAQRGLDPSRATVVGEAALCDRYVVALREAGVAAERGPPDAAARGLWRIARAAGIVR